MKTKVHEFILESLIMGSLYFLSNMTLTKELVRFKQRRTYIERKCFQRMRGEIPNTI